MMCPNDEVTIFLLVVVSMLVKTYFDREAGGQKIMKKPGTACLCMIMNYDTSINLIVGF